MVAGDPKGDDRTRDNGKITPHPASRRAETGPARSHTARWTRRYWPLLVAGLSSALWLGAVAAFFLTGDGAPSPDTFSLPEIGAMAAGVTMPLVLIWICALVILRTDLLGEQRIAVAQGLDELLSPVDQAERRATALTEKLRQQIENVENASEIASDRIKRLEDRFQNQINDLFSATTKAEETANGVVMRLRGEEQALKGLRISLEEMVTGIETRLQHAGETLISNSNAAGAQVNRAQESLTSEGRALDETFTGLTERLEEIDSALKQAMGSLESGVDSAEARAGEAARTLLSHEEQLRQAMTALAEEAQTSGGSMSSEGQKLAALRTQAVGDAEALEKAIDAAQARLRDAGESIREQTTATVSDSENALEALTGRLGETLEQARSDIEALSSTMSEATSGLEGQLASARTRTEEDSQAISDLIRTRTEDAASTLEARAEELRALLADEQAVVDSAIEDHAKTVAEALDEQARAVRAAVSQQNQTVHDSIAQQKQQLADALEDHLKRLEESLARHMAGTGEHLADADERAVKQLEENVERLRGILGEQGSAAEELLARYGATFEDRIRGALGEAEAALNQESASIEEAATRAETEITRLSALLQQSSQDLSRTGTEAADATTLLGTTLGERLSGLDTTVASIDRAIKDITERTERFEKTASTEGQGSFARTSALVIESLGSAAIDINRALETEIPDNVWQRYLKGDRSIFARRTLRLGTRKAQKAIAAKYESDGEFRTYAEEYLREFESLMGQAMTADPKNVLSATLVSSELGKLYVLLAQSLNRFS